MMDLGASEGILSGFLIVKGILTFYKFGLWTGGHQSFLASLPHSLDFSGRNTEIMQ